MAYALSGSAMERLLRRDYGWSPAAPVPRRRDPGYAEDAPKPRRTGGLLGAVKALLGGARA